MSPVFFRWLLLLFQPMLNTDFKEIKYILGIISVFLPDLLNCCTVLSAFILMRVEIYGLVRGGAQFTERVNVLNMLYSQITSLMTIYEWVNKFTIY